MFLARPLDGGGSRQTDAETSEYKPRCRDFSPTYRNAVEDRFVRERASTLDDFKARISDSDDRRLNTNCHLVLVLPVTQPSFDRIV